MNNKCMRDSMNRIQSKDHRIQTYEINKISLSCFDDKTYIQNNGYDGLALGITVNYEKTVSIQKIFFVQLILIFSLIRKAYLPSYKNYCFNFQSNQYSFFANPKKYCFNFQSTKGIFLYFLF